MTVTRNRTGAVDEEQSTDDIFVDRAQESYEVATNKQASEDIITTPLACLGPTDGLPVVALTKEASAGEVQKVVAISPKIDADSLELQTSVASTNVASRVGEHQLVAAIREGHMVKALRELGRLENGGKEDPRWLLDAATLERVRRIGAWYSESLKDLLLAPAASPGGYPEAGGWERSSQWRDTDGLDTWLRYDNDGGFQAVSSVLCDGGHFDAYQAFVGLCEFDVRQKYDPDVVDAKLLKQRGLDGLWRVRKRPRHGSREDNILHVSCLDALDENPPLLWCSCYTPEEESLASGIVNDVHLPPPEEAACRIHHYRDAVTIEPRGAGTFLLSLGVSRRVHKAAYLFPGNICEDIEQMMQGFMVFLRDSPDLEWRAMGSPQAAFFDRVRRRLANNGTIRRTGALSFEHLSLGLPVDWADMHEDTGVSL